jgi:hypothetical protein
MEDWDMDGEGNLKMYVFRGYESATAPGNVLLRMLYFSENSDLPPNTLDGFQVTLTPDSARKFAADLLANADQAEKS